MTTSSVRIDAQRWLVPPDYLFDGAAWPRNTGRAGAGRGAAWFVSDGTGDYVLRHFRRGGLVARLSQAHYVATGAASSRGFREFEILQHLRARGLPVPAPAAAGYWRRGMFYRAAILTVSIPDSETLAARLAREPLDEAQWRTLGTLIARFHAAGAWHADLNAHNVLIDAAGDFHLIDFDRARLRAPGGWSQANLARLHRSLEKLRTQGDFHADAADWTALTQGYATSSSASAS
ncbi:MAG: 3-deoxy-D-manno-octulosonic acid kinase [Pseudomonadota bacterium]